MGETTDADGWQSRTEELHEHGGIPERRAEIVALAEQGLTNQEIADEIGWNRSGIWKEIDSYRDQRDEGEWLAKYGPDI